MPEDFNTYGQISPMAFNLDQSNQDEQQLDSTYMNMIMGFEDAKDRVLIKKQKEMEMLGEQINAEHEKIKGVSLVDDPSIIEKDFQNNLVTLKNLYKVPGDQRDVEWNRQKSYAMSNINSPIINNDQENKQKLEKMQQLYMKGDIGYTNYYNWYNSFMAKARKGEKVEVTDVPDPVGAEENFMANAYNLVNYKTWNPATAFEPGTMVIKQSEWDSFYDNQIFPESISDLSAKFDNLPEEIKQGYIERGQRYLSNSVKKDRDAMKLSGAKQYGYEILKDYRYKYAEEAARSRVGQRPSSTKEAEDVDWFTSIMGDAIKNTKPTTKNPDGSISPSVPRYVTSPGTNVLLGGDTQDAEVQGYDLGRIKVGNNAEPVQVFFDAKINPQHAAWEGTEKERATVQRTVKLHYVDGDNSGNLRASVQNVPVRMNNSAMKDLLKNANYYYKDQDGNKVSLTYDDIKTSFKGSNAKASDDMADDELLLKFRVADKRYAGQLADFEGGVENPYRILVSKNAVVNQFTKSAFNYSLGINKESSDKNVITSSSNFQ